MTFVKFTQTYNLQLSRLLLMQKHVYGICLYSVFTIYFYVVQVYAVAERRPLREHRLPCCGLGLGWFL